MAELEHLFLGPAMLRKGIGSALFEYALHWTRSRTSSG
jgi:GNAT superfamily N-acetyltransferase